MEERRENNENNSGLSQMLAGVIQNQQTIQLQSNQMISLLVTSLTNMSNRPNPPVAYMGYGGAPRALGPSDVQGNGFFGQFPGYPQQLLPYGQQMGGLSTTEAPRLTDQQVMQQLEIMAQPGAGDAPGSPHNRNVPGPSDQHQQDFSSLSHMHTGIVSAEQQYENFFPLIARNQALGYPPGTYPPPEATANVEAPPQAPQSPRTPRTPVATRPNIQDVTTPEAPVAQQPAPAPKTRDSAAPPAAQQPAPVPQTPAAMAPLPENTRTSTPIAKKSKSSVQNPPKRGRKRANHDSDSDLSDDEVFSEPPSPIRRHQDSSDEESETDETMTSIDVGYRGKGKKSDFTCDRCKSSFKSIRIFNTHACKSSKSKKTRKSKR